MTTKIKCEDAVLALKRRGLSTRAAVIADYLGTDARAVATALRAATKDGRVSITYKRGIGWYRFKRLTPNALGEGRERGILREASSGEAATSTDGLDGKGRSDAG